MYTFKPDKKYAKACGRNLRISTKQAIKICRVIRNKPLDRAKRLLKGLADEKRKLGTRYYSKTVAEMLNMVNSCEKNAESLGLDVEKLFVHASAHTGPIIKRRRRKSAFGSRMKSTNIEIMLIEKGKEKKQTLEQLKRMAKELKKAPEEKENKTEKEAVKENKVSQKG